MRPEACEEKNTLSVIAPKRRKNWFIVRLIITLIIKNAKNLPAVKLRPSRK
jgi:hypothetical protein